MAGRNIDREQYIVALETELAMLQEENTILKKQNISLEDLFSKAFDNHPIPMAITTLHGGKYKAVNQSYLEALGFTREEMIGKDSLDLGIWIDPEHAKYIGEQLIENNLFRCFESKIRNKSGSTGTALTYFNITDIDGQKHVITSVVDITELKKVEESLRLSDEKFSKAFYENQVPMTITRFEDGVIIDANSNFAETFGYLREELIGKSIYSELNISSLNNEEIEEKLKHLKEFGFVENEELRIKKRNGDIGYLITTHTLLYLNGELCRLTSGIDITKRKKAEEELSRSQELFQRVFHNIPLSIIIISFEDYRVVEVNDTFLTRNNVSREELIGLKNAHFQFWREPEQMDIYAETVRINGLVKNFEVQYNLHNRENRTVLVSGILINWEGEECILSISNDITELRQYERELYKLDRLNLMGQMAGSIAHEVRNPMTSVKGFLQLFHQQYKYREDRESIDLMIEELDRANDIISSFLSLAKNNLVDIKLQSLTDNLTSVIPLIIADAIKNDVYVDTKLGIIPKIFIDKGEIRQLILNLTKNALQAMPSGGNLIIETFENNDGVNLIIQDEGCGIPSHIMANIGTPFLTTKEDGTGLGMAVCYSIAKRHNARIDIKTGSDGTRFKITFPFAIESLTIGKKK